MTNDVTERVKSLGLLRSHREWMEYSLHNHSLKVQVQSRLQAAAVGNVSSRSLVLCISMKKRQATCCQLRKVFHRNTQKLVVTWQHVACCWLLLPAVGYKLVYLEIDCRITLPVRLMCIYLTQNIAYIYLSIPMSYVYLFKF